MKKCSKCLKTKPNSRFYPDYNRKVGLQSWCKKCQSLNAAKYITKCAAKEGLTAKQYRRKVKLKKYGLSLEELALLLKDQGGCCAICGESESELPRDLVVDHCHTTQRVRGLLCHKCNVALGGFRDDIDILASATSYLLNV